MKNRYVDLEVLNHGLKELATKINSVFRKIKDSYTKTEIDDKFTSVAKGMNWKPSVATKVDLEALTDNSKSDTRIVEDESKIYMYNGTSWEGIGSSANVPKATIDNDGLMSKEDFTKLKGIEPDKYETKEDFNTKVGSLTSLNTDNKDSVVSAINEVKEGVNNTVKIDDTVVDTNKVYSSKKINDTYVKKEENKSLVPDSEIEKIHTHTNKNYLDKISENAEGKPTYNGKEIGTGGSGANIDDTNISTDTTYSSEKIEGKFVGEIEGYTDDELKAMLGLSEDDKDLIKNLITDDSVIDTAKTWNSSVLNKKVSEIKTDFDSFEGRNIEYGQFGFDNTIKQISTTDTLIPFKTKVGNIDLNSDGTITLKANKTYKLSCYFRVSDTDALKSLSVKRNGTFLFNVVAKASEITETCTSVYIFTPTENAKVGLYTTVYDIQLPTLTSTAFYNNTKLIVEEIAQPVINNINYTIDKINDKTKLEDSPIGQIISFMGTKAPVHYLICDGSIYNISDYQKLADFFKEQFGSYNYFGGNGTTTFAVPDLRNEFIRGYHGTSSEQLSGEIGKHQNATIIQNPIATNSSNNFLYTPIPNNVQKLIVGNENNSDTAITETNNGINKYSTSFEAQTATVVTSYTTRPTNVSVLFCIKYENTYYANITNINTRKETVLYDEKITLSSKQNLTYTLKEPITNFDKIKIIGYLRALIQREFDVNDLLNKAVNCELTHFYSTSYYVSCPCGFSDENTFIIYNPYTVGWSLEDMYIYKIIGIKYNSNSSSDIDLTKSYTDDEVNH